MNKEPKSKNRNIGFISKLRWLFSSNPKHQINQKLSELDLRKKEVKELQKQLKKHVNKLHNQSIRLAQLQSHFLTNNKQTLKEIKELKEFKKEKQDVEHAIKILHKFIGYVPDDVAEEFVNSKDFMRFQKVLCKHFKDYELLE